jgi:hypothetical protein
MASLGNHFPLAVILPAWTAIVTLTFVEMH